MSEPEDTLAATLRSISDAVLTADADGHITRMNPPAERLTGWPLADALGRPHAEVFRIRSDPAGGDRSVLTGRDGAERTVATITEPIRDAGGCVSGTAIVFHEILGNEALEHLVEWRTRQLRESEERLNMALRMGHIGGWELDLTNHSAQRTEGHDRIFGYEQLLPVWTYETFLDHVLPDDRAEVDRTFRQAAEARKPWDFECRIRRADGVVRWITSRGERLPDETGRAPRAAGIVLDITERKDWDARLHSKLEHLRLLDHITRAIGERQDLGSIFHAVVSSLEESLPIDFGCVCLRDEAGPTVTVACVGAKSKDLALEMMMPEHSVIHIEKNGLSHCMRGELVYERDLSHLQFPFPQRLARGGLGSAVMAPLRAETRVFGLLIAARRDANAFTSTECEFMRQVSEHVALAAQQAQLQQTLREAYEGLHRTHDAMIQEERLRALGQMASGIAHDINNTLSPVALYAESLLETEPDLSERARGYLKTIQRAVDDVAQTAGRMREFYRQREPQLVLTPVQLNELAQQVLDLTRARWHDMPLQAGVVIQPKLELAPDLPPILGAESEIREALTNLVLNAVDAMPAGGALTLRTKALPAGPHGARASLEVADEGVGMDADTRRRCLEPFFTTKGERGTGLGLAMVFGMAKRHSADLEVESAPGAGTTVRLTFAVPGVMLPAAAPERPRGPLPRLKLLLIDDDPIILRSLHDALEVDGHEIIGAHGGEAGIAAFRAALAEGKPFDAVITDLGMPNVDGHRVAAAVKESSPKTPVILLTGWGQRLVDQRELPANIDLVVPKPPKLNDLRDALATLCAPVAS